MRLKFILLIIVALAASARAQELKTQDKSEDAQQAVTNDDQGRAFIITGESQRISTSGIHGQAVISAPQQYSLFVGSDWAAEKLRATEPELSNLLSNIKDQKTVHALDRLGIKNFFGATLSQELLDVFPGDRNVSDLDIQDVLRQMLDDGRLSLPNANTIYVVFLDPQLHSTLGPLVADKHYAAYHNFFNTSDVKVHYVVCPYQKDLPTARAVVEQAFLAAVLNPSGSIQY